MYESVPPEQAIHDSVGRPIVHRAAYQQATGEAVYIDDIPERKGEILGISYIIHLEIMQ